MKLTKAEWSDFCASLPDDVYMDEDDATFTESSANDELGEVSYGALMWEGEFDEEVRFALENFTKGEAEEMIVNRGYVDLMKVLRRWKKSRNFTYVTLECPNDKLSAVLDAIAEYGAKVVK